MNFIQLLLLQFVAHLLTDYIFQPDKNAREKNESGFRSPFLKWHVLIAFLSSWVLSFQLKFVFAALLIALFHGLADGYKMRLNQFAIFRSYAFFADQAFHLLFLLLVVFLYNHYSGIEPIKGISFSTRFLLIFAGYLVCTKPANILVKEVLLVFQVKARPDGDPGADLPNAGKLIGILERCLVLTFILLKQYEAIGFLIAAKSILRFREDDTVKTEYVLTGTLLSFAIAVATGLIIYSLQIRFS